MSKLEPADSGNTGKFRQRDHPRSETTREDNNLREAMGFRTTVVDGRTTVSKPKQRDHPRSETTWGDNFREAMGFGASVCEPPHDMEQYFQERGEKKLQKAMTGIRERGVMAGAEELRYVLEMLIKDEGLIAAVNHIEEFGIEGLSLEERQELKQIIDENIVSKKTAKSDLEKEYDRLVIGALLAYVLLFLWLASIGYFVRGSNKDNCHILDASTGDIPSACRDLYGGHTAVLQNITFGLVTAVTIAQMDYGGDGDHSLQERFKAIRVGRREKEIQERYEVVDSKRIQRKLWKYTWRKHLQRIYDFLIFKSPEIFVVCWIVGGLTCLITTVRYYDAENPLFSTGQTWLGIAVTRTYTYFGVSKGSGTAGQADSPNETSEDYGKASRDGSNKTLLSSFEESRKVQRQQHPALQKSYHKRSRSPPSTLPHESSPDGCNLDKTDEYIIGDSDDDSINDQDQDIAGNNNTQRHRNNLDDERSSELMHSSHQSNAHGPWMVLQTGERLSLPSKKSIEDDTSEENSKKTQGSKSLNSISLQMSVDEVLADGDDDKV